MNRKNIGHIYVFLVLIISIAVIGVLDYITGYRFNFSVLYLIPVLFAVWQEGLIMGFAVAVISVAIWFFADISAGKTYYSAVAQYWNGGVRLAMLIVPMYFFHLFYNKVKRDIIFSRNDTLTGLYSRQYFFELANRELARCRRLNKPVIIAFIDCDNFKKVNDNFGHSVGDAVLRVIGSEIVRNIRALDLAVRMGGDEFVLLMPEADEAMAKSCITRIGGRLLSVMRDNRWPVTFSIGVGTFYAIPDPIKEMIKKSDESMYAAKRAGKNKTFYFKITD